MIFAVVIVLVEFFQSICFVLINNKPRSQSQVPGTSMVLLGVVHDGSKKLLDDSGQSLPVGLGGGGGGGVEGA